MTFQKGNKLGVKHGHAYRGRHSRAYVSWTKMKIRCNNPNQTYYDYYGGRGITYDPRWETFEPFLEDMGERPDGYSLDRIDNDGNYTKANCKWSTPSEQAYNRRPWKWKKKAA